MEGYHYRRHTLAGVPIRQRLASRRRAFLLARIREVGRCGIGNER